MQIFGYFPRPPIKWKGMPSVNLKGIKTKASGFTLIEVLIAMTLLGVMVVLLFSSLRIAAESWEAGETKTAQVNQKAVVYQFLKRHLTAIRPLPKLDNQQEGDIESMQVFEGSPQGLRFAGALPASSARKGVQVFSIFLNPNRLSTLMVSLSPYRQTEGQTKQDPPVVLLEGVSSLKFSYFGKTEDVAEMIWRDEWTLADRLPSLIEVSILLKDGSYWPSMVFAPKITQAPNVESTAEEETSADSILDVQ